MFVSSNNAGKNREDTDDKDGEREREIMEGGLGEGGEGGGDGGDGGGDGNGGRGQSNLHTHQDAGPFFTLGHQNFS